MAEDDKVKHIVGELLVAMGIHTKAGQITLHLDGDGVVQQVETTVYRKVRRAPVGARVA
jgi:hypothetical protein